jgi:hypothetical protein
MLDGKAYQAHFPDDPVYGISSPSSAPCQLNSPALMEALAALEPEFRTILSQVPPSQCATSRKTRAKSLRT